MDRIDLYLYVPAVSTDKLNSRVSAAGVSSITIRSRVIAARKQQYARFLDVGLHVNTEISTKLVRERCPFCDQCQQFLGKAIDTFRLSALSYYGFIKVARTIADLSQAGSIELQHIAEALQFRPKEIGE